MGRLTLLSLAAASLMFAAGCHAQFVTVAPGGAAFATDTCEDLAIALYNSWEAVEAGAGLVAGGPDALATQFATAREAGLNAVRFNAFATQEGQALQLGPDQYDPTLLEGLDTAIAEAGNAGLKIILVLATNWDYTGNASDTKAYYSNQSVLTQSPDNFFVDNTAITAYLNHVRFITSRVNSVNGLAYNEDPAIMAWDLINEGRCETETCTAAKIMNWLARVAPAVKAYIPNQLLTIGQEGFWQADNCASDTTNPVNNTDGWPLRTGQDFLANHALDSIDFTSTHLLPINWARQDNTFSTAWLNGHSRQSGLINKPLLIELFATQVGVNDFVAQNSSDLYKLVYAIAEASVITGGAIRGVGFSLWDGVAISPNSPGADNTTFVSSTGPEWLDTIVPYAGRISARCPAAGPSPAASAPLAAASARRLLQAGSATAPAPAIDTAAINSQVPAAFCAADDTLYAAPSMAPSLAEAPL